MPEKPWRAFAFIHEFCVSPQVRLSLPLPVTLLLSLAVSNLPIFALSFCRAASHGCFLPQPSPFCGGPLRRGRVRRRDTSYYNSTKPYKGSTTSYYYSLLRGRCQGVGPPHEIYGADGVRSKRIAPFTPDSKIQCAKITTSGRTRG